MAAIAKQLLSPNFLALGDDILTASLPGQEDTHDTRQRARGDTTP
jgi:hypothetical protein